MKHLTNFKPASICLIAVHLQTLHNSVAETLPP